MYAKAWGAMIKLRSMSSPHAYTALSLNEAGSVYIALNQQGFPTLLVTTQDQRPTLKLRTDAASLQLRADLYVHLPNQGRSQGRFHVLQCESTEPELADTFVILIDALLSVQGTTPATAEDLSDFFRTLTHLFSITPAQDLRKERQGLWGELFVMRFLGGASIWARFWHMDPYRNFDFSAERRRLEVKTSVGLSRVHSFSHRQLSNVGGERIAIASLLLREDPNGLSLLSLVQEARDELSSDPASLAKLEASVRLSGMERMNEAGPSFDEKAAARDLAWFWSSDVPRFSQPEPSGVSGTRYRVDLSSSVHIPTPELSGWLDSWIGLEQARS